MEIINVSNISLDSLNSSISTDDQNYRKMLKTISDYLTVFSLIVIMLSMGTDILFKEVWNHLRKPIGILIGMICQFVVMPVLGFLLLKAMRLEEGYALGVLLVSCCPGGAVSNVFCYFVDGDVSLSVSMTSMSTLLALGFLPLNIWMYGSSSVTGSLVIPYGNIATSLAFVTLPAAIGMVIRWKAPKTAMLVTKVGSLLGFVLIALCVTLQNLAYPESLKTVPWRLLVLAVVMPSSGIILGFLAALLCRRCISMCKTVAIECGVQNVAIAMAIISLSPFSFEAQRFFLLFPMLYGVSMILLCTLVCFLYQLYVKLRPVNTGNLSGKETEMVKY